MFTALLSQKIVYTVCALYKITTIMKHLHSGSLETL